MEEASVAGESPDRSKQRESSAEPTSGNTGPVPEARTEERDARDPRLAVARDGGGSSAGKSAGGSSSGSSSGSPSGSPSGSGSGSSGEAGARGGVDTATRVFSVRGLVAGAEGVGGAGEAEDVREAGDAEDAGQVGDAGSAQDARRATDAGGVEGAGDAGKARDAGGSQEAAEASGRGGEGSDGAEAGGAGKGSARGGDVSADAGTTPGDGAATDGPHGDPAGDARLRAAVAAWVRSGDSKGSGGAGGEETAAEGAGAGDSGDTGDTGDSGGAKGEAGDVTATEGAGGAAGEETRAEAAGDEDLGDAEGDGRASADDADAAGEQRAEAETDGTDRDDADEPEAAAADEPAAADDKAAEPAAQAEDPAKAEDRTDVEPEAGTAAADDSDAESAPEDATDGTGVSVAGRAREAAGGAGAAVTDGAGAAADASADGESAAADGTGVSVADGEPAAAGGAGAAVTDGAGAAADASADGESAAADGTGVSVADGEPAAAGGAGAAVTDGAGAGTGASADTADDGASAVADRTDADTAAADRTDASATDEEPATADGADAAAASEKSAAADPDATDDEPAAADGEDAPQGPPAPGDESGTGGAGGKEKGEAGGRAGGRAVDQPTAVFKRPKPQVDQPTTMLKLGGTKSPETPEPSEAERTSKFVALKPLDEPRTPKPTEVTSAVPQVGPERTAQQPLPPKPPLDLLAELTNTPPPPQTPVRTIVRRIKIWTPLVLLLAVVFAIVQAVRPLPTPTLALTADDSYTFDGNKADLPWPNEGQGRLDVNGIGTMGTFGKQTPVPIGSVAKSMTAYIVLKDHPLKSGQEGEKITVDALAEKEGGYDKDNESTLNTVKNGDVLTEKQALSAIMIPSANNIARLLARWDAGSEAAFIKKMNDTAKELGMKNTTYTDASGLKETTVSTAEDQVKLGNELVKIPALTDITKLPTWTDPSGKKWDNFNRLVPYNGAIGIKTGTTTKAGGNLLFAATKEVGGETVIVVGAILGQHTTPIIDTVIAVSKTAMIAAQSALTSTKILKKGDVVGYVDDQLGGHTPVVLTKDVAAVGWAGLKVKLSFAADAVPHTAKAGTQVGTLTVGDSTGGAVKVPVALQKDLAEPGFMAKLKRLG
jgi:D-alanyl-D-alanine carboxypeptidase (penicillin-binding protein 5/6)